MSMLTPAVMAATFQTRCPLWRLLLRQQKQQQRSLHQNDHHNKHSQQKSTYVIRLSRDESCFIAHHPDIRHDYEHTKPMPVVAASDDTILRVDSKHMFTKAPNQEQLQALTYTHKRHWFQYAGKEKRDALKAWQDDKSDRKGLSS